MNLTSLRTSSNDLMNSMIQKTYVKSIVFFLIAACGFKNAYAQQDTTNFKQSRKGYLGISFGPSFPSVMNPEIHRRVEGERGLDLALIDFGYYFHKNFGITLKWEQSAFPLAYYETIPQLHYKYPLKFKNDIWGLNEYLVGIRVAFPKKKLTKSFGLLAGIQEAKTPAILLASDSAGLSFNQETFGKSTNLVIDLDFMFNYHLGKKFDFLFTISFIYSEPKYAFDVITYGYEPDQQKLHLSILDINTTAGFAYRLR